MEQQVIGLVGNPNCGKTTLFNRLTGSRQVTGNWPGVTVERKEGQVKNHPWTVVDLPGTYSLASYSPEEQVAADFLQKSKPDLILNIVDATALERNLYLTTQLLELGTPMVVALNLYDALKEQGGRADWRSISHRLGVAVVPLSARSGENMEALIDAIESALKNAPSSKRKQWIPDEAAFRAEKRYADVDQVLKGTYQNKTAAKAGWTEKLDDIFTHRFLAIPLFLFVMLMAFSLIFGPVGMALKGWAEQGIQLIAGWLSRGLDAAGASWWVKEMLLEGIWAGVGGMLTFLPQMALLFLFLSLLEDSGYMARGAFVMDQILRKAGLSGKAFIPLLMGFGCTTPAAMATRTLEREKERKLSVLMLPFFSCGAKLPVYVLFSAAFFPASKGLVIFGLYILGIALGVLYIRLVGGSVVKGQDAPFVMEMPPYRWPTLFGTLRHLWDKCKGFVVKAGTVIVSLSALIWLMQHVTCSLTWTNQASISLFGFLGEKLAPFFAPLGFGNWQAAVSLLAGIVAKEAVVSSMASLYTAGGAISLTGALQGAFTPASALSFLVFVLLYMPCVSAFATIRRELGGWRQGLLAMAAQTCIAYGVSFVVYQLARTVL